MASNRGRKFYRHDLVPSVDRRQHDVLHARHTDSHNYLPRFIASDPMYNHIRWIDEYMAYFRLNFFTPNNSFSHPREMVNTINRPSLIKYPPSFRDMQGISYKKRQKIPKWIRTRTFWRKKNLNDNQYSEENLYDSEYQDDRESEETNESSDWRKNWRTNCLDENYRVETERCGNKENFKFATTNMISSVIDEVIDTSRIKLEELHIGDNEEVKQDSISSEDITSSYIREQMEIFELLKECDYRHQLLFNMGLNWFEGKYKQSDSDESDSEDDIQIIIKMPKNRSENTAENQDKENIDIDWRKRKSNFNLLNDPVNTLKRQKMSETDDIQKRILEMKAKRQTLKEKLEQKMRHEKQRATKSRKAAKVPLKLNIDNIFSCVITNSTYSSKIKEEVEETEQWRKLVESANSFETFSTSYSLNLEYSYKIPDDSKEHNDTRIKKDDMKLITSLSASSFTLENVSDLNEILDQVKRKDLVTHVSKEFVSEMMDWFQSNVEKQFIVQQPVKLRMFKGYKLKFGQHNNVKQSVMKSDKNRISVGDNLDVKGYQRRIWPDLEISKNDLLMERLKRLDIAANFASEMMKYIEDWRQNPVICLKWHNISKLNRRSIEEKSEHNADFLCAKLPELEFSSEFSPEFDQIWKITSNRITSTPNSLEAEEFFNNNLDLSWESSFGTS